MAGAQQEQTELECWQPETAKRRTPLMLKFLYDPGTSSAMQSRDNPALTTRGRLQAVIC
jgi:hypothetical protein